MAIQGQQVKKFRDFRGGRIANENPSTMPENHLLAAVNVFLLGDGVIRRRKGYTQVLAAANLAAKLLTGYDFQRTVDQKAFVLLNAAGELAYMNQDGTGYTLLSAAEDAAKIHQFISSDHSCYCGNGVKMYALLDTGDGLLHQKNWGLPTPQVAPTLAYSAGSLTLQNGRQYVFCPVRRWTDSLGTARFHIGAPSPLSAYTGPQTSKVVNVGLPAVPDDPQTTHWWIFATQDVAFQTSGFFAFAAEVTVGTTTWGDTLTDAQLDTTRSAPFFNLQPPKAEIITEYQSRPVWCYKNIVQLAGFEEIALGVSYETAPPFMIFPVPGGSKRISATCVMGTDVNSILLISTPDYWFQITGYDQTTLTKHDKLIEPGAIGKKAVDATLPGWVVFLGSDKKLWAWDGVSNTAQALNLKIANNLLGQQLTLSDLDDAQLANAEVHCFSWGQYFFVLVLASTTGHNGYFDWIQVWDASNIARGSQITLMQTNTSQLMAESDFFPFHQITAAWVQKVGNTKYVFLGAMDGAVYRFPDGNTDAGQIIPASCDLVPSPLDEPDMKKVMLFTDVLTNRNDPVTAFQVNAGATSGQMPAAMVPLPTAIKFDAEGNDPTIARGRMNVKGAAIGIVAHIQIVFPNDANDAEIFGVDVAFRPVYEEQP